MRVETSFGIINETLRDYFILNSVDFSEYICMSQPSVRLVESFTFVFPKFEFVT